MPSAIDIFVSYKFIKQLATPWTEWEAYELGLIDKNGKKIKRASTATEKAAYPRWKILVRNIKILLDKLPFGRSKLGSFAGALYLLKEELNVEASVLEERFIEYIKSENLLIETENGEKINTLERGRYKHIDGSAIFLKNDVSALDIIFDTPVFEVTDYITGKEYVVTSEELENF